MRTLGVVIVLLFVAPESHAGGGAKRFDELDRPKAKPSAAIAWDGTVVWSGARFEGTYDNLAGDCALGRVNTQLAGVQSYLTGITVDGTNGRVAAESVVKYPQRRSPTTARADRSRHARLTMRLTRRNVTPFSTKSKR